MSKLLFSFIGIILVVHVSAQDTLFLRSKDTLAAAILEINTETIRYKKPGASSEAELLIPKTDVGYVVFRNGRRFEMDSAKISESSPSVVYVESPSTNGKDMFRKGAQDAHKYYDHPCGAVATGISTFAFGLVGLIPAILISGTPPKDENLGYPDSELWKNQHYQEGYRLMAKKIKVRKVWTGFGIGMALLAAPIIFVLAR